MHITGALPQIHFASSAFHDPSAEVLVWNKENVSVCRGCAHDLVGVTAGADHISQRFHACAAVDISDYVIVFVRVLSQKFRQLVRRARF